ncbi:MAG: ACT domain-containing protein [Desulfobaccales bacterium]
MERKIERSRVGGLKVLEGGACLVASFPQDEGRLAERVCTPLALNRINLSFFTHMASDREVLCTASRSGEAAFTLLRTQAGSEAAMHLQPGTAILSLYPHDKRPEIIGNFILSLAQSRVMVHGLGSSPAAISVVLPSRKVKAAVNQLFDNFHFPAFSSPQEFFAAQSPPEELLRQVVASYQEKVTKVYWIVPQPDLDLWGLNVSSTDILAGFADALLDLGSLGLQIPFLVALPGLGGKEFLLSFSTYAPQPGGERGPEIRRILKERLPDLRPIRLTPVASISLHGPHFGDRFGIARTLTVALEKAHISLLALSCTISTISLIIRQYQLAAAQLVLVQTFAAPVEVSTPAAAGPGHEYETG